MPEKATGYSSFLLRLWWTLGPEGGRWLGEVERIQDGRRWRFVSLEEIAAFFAAPERFLEDEEQ